MDTFCGGSKGIGGIRNAIESEKLPQENSIEYEGIYYEYSFETGKTDKIFDPVFFPTITKDPISQNLEYYLCIGLNGCLDGDGLEKSGGRQPMNFLVCMDTSFSMGSPFSRKKKIDVMKEVIVSTLLPKLKDNDNLCVVQMFDDTKVIQPFEQLSKIDKFQLKNNIFSINPFGGTSLTGGITKVTELFDQILSQKQQSNTHVNRMFVLTDAIPTDKDSDGAQLLKLTKHNSDKDILATYVGIGKNFDAGLTKRLGEIPGVNWFALETVPEFKKIMDRDFDYLMTVSYNNLVVRIEGGDYEVERVFGCPGYYFPPKETLLEVQFSSPSAKEDEELTKGGIVVVKLNKVRDTGEEIRFPIEYTRNGIKISDEKKLTFPKYEGKEIWHVAARKAILLTRYVNLLKYYIRDERRRLSSGSQFKPSINFKTGIIAPPPLNEEEKKADSETSLILGKLHDTYLEIFKKFKNYYEEEALAIDDNNLINEMKLINNILEVNNKVKKHSQPISPPNKKGEANHYKKISKELHKLSSLKINPPTAPKNHVDVCFLMDITGSMGSWIDMCKKQVENIVELLMSSYTELVIKIAFVGYRDHSDDKPKVLNFTPDVKKVKQFISTVIADGGNDTPEDVCGGLRLALDLDWTSTSRIIIFIADAPCHGTFYHDCDDDYPKGDPKGLHPEVLISECFARGIKFFFANLESITDRMLEIWQKHLSVHSPEHVIKSFSISQDEEFVANISDAIASTISKH